MTNLAEATVDTDTFGLSMLGDGATIKMMALSSGKSVRTLRDLRASSR